MIGDLWPKRVQDANERMTAAGRPANLRTRRYMEVLAVCQDRGVSDDTIARVIDECSFDREWPSPEQLMARITVKHFRPAFRPIDVADLMEQAA